jgi:hypothetical protein
MVRLARLNTRTGGEPRHAREPAAGVFRRAGDWWWVGLTGEPFRVKDTKGMRYLAALLRHPGQELHVMVLAADHGLGHPAPGARAMADGDLRVGDPGDAGEMLDAEARAAYRSRLAELRDER